MPPIPQAPVPPLGPFRPSFGTAPPSTHALATDQESLVSIAGSLLAAALAGLI